MRPLPFLAFVALTLSAFAGPASFYLSDLAFKKIDDKENAAQRLIQYLPQGQTLQKYTALYSIIQLKAAKANAGDWYDNMLQTISTNPNSKLIAQDGENLILVYTASTDKVLEYNIWRIGTDAHGQVIANGLAFHFVRPADKDRFTTFMEKSADGYYNTFISSPLLSFAPGEK